MYIGGARHPGNSAVMSLTVLHLRLLSLPVDF
jgi:hypothetical protein